MKISIKELTQLLRDVVDHGNLERRIIGISKSSSLYSLCWAINDLLDKVETFMRDAQSQLRGHPQVKKATVWTFVALTVVSARRSRPLTKHFGQVMSYEPSESKQRERFSLTDAIGEHVVSLDQASEKLGATVSVSPIWLVLCQHCHPT